MNCPSCNAQTEPGASFCVECGAVLDLAATGPTIRFEHTLPNEPPPLLYQQDIDKVWFAAYRNAVHSMAVPGDVGVRAQDFAVKHAVQALVRLEDLMLFLQREIADKPMPDWLIRVVMWGAHKLMTEPDTGPETHAFITSATAIYQRAKSGLKPSFEEAQDCIRITMAFNNPSGHVRERSGAIR